MASYCAAHHFWQKNHPAGIFVLALPTNRPPSCVGTHGVSIHPVNTEIPTARNPNKAKSLIQFVQISVFQVFKLF
jgi:hypothetical protein